MLDLATYSAALPIVSRINELHQQIEALRPISPEQEQRILQKYRLDWNYHSNAIEGNSLTYGETRAFLMHGLTAKGKPLKDHLDIRGHNKAIDFLYQMIKEDTEITETDIRSLHEVILVEPYEVDTRTEDGIPAKKRIQLGKYKTSPNHVLTQTGEIHHYATPEETPILMQELVDVYRQNRANPQVHPYILAAYFHYRFTAIHPFDDGNGRMARLMMNLLLMKAGYPPVIIRQEKASREAYYYALSQADAGEFVPFFELIGEALLHSMELYVKGAKGESLEEPDDLDKELALLKRELETIESKIEKINTLENQIAVYKNAITPFLESLDKMFSKFTGFFVEYTTEVWEPDTQGKFQLTSPLRGIQVRKKTKQLYIHKFNSFIDKNTPFSVVWMVEITFNHLDYKITIDKKYYLTDFLESWRLDVYPANIFFGSTLNVIRDYHKYLSTNEISKLTDKIGQSFMKGIKSLKSKYEEINNYHPDI